MDQNLWLAIKELKVADKEAIEDFVSLTAPRLRATFPDDNELVEVYQQLARRHHHLRRGDDFWAWTQRQFPKLTEDTEKVSEQTIHLLTDEIETTLQSFRPGRNFRNFLARLSLSLFLFALIWMAISLFASGDIRHQRFGSLIGLRGSTMGWWINLLALCGLSAATFSFFVSPWVGWWRKQIYARSTPLMAALTTLLVVVGTPLVFVFLDLHRRLLYSYNEWAEWSPGVLKGFTIQVAELFPRTWDDEEAWIVAVVCFAAFWAGLAIIKKQTWVINRDSKWWRKLPLILLIGLLIVPAYNPKLPLVWEGSFLEPELVVYCNSIRRPPYEYPEQDQSLVDEFHKKLGADLSVLRKMPKRLSHFGPEELSKLWLDVGDELWSQEEWWKDSRFQSYMSTVYQIRSMSFPEELDQYGPARAEAELRLAFENQLDFYVCRILYLTEAKPEDWQRLKQLCFELQDGLEHKLEHSLVEIGWGFKDSASMLAQTPTYTDWLQLCEYRRDLNLVWNEYRAAEGRLRDHAPFTRAEEDQLMEGSYLRPRLVVERERRMMAFALMICDLKYLAAQGQQVPSSVKELSPDVRASVEPVEDWFIYRVEGDEVHIEIDPRDVQRTYFDYESDVFKFRFPR